VVAAGLAGWFAATVAGQHPNLAFDRVRGLDPLGSLIGNWRFFAPKPARHDFALLHRTLRADGAQTPWAQSATAAPRRLAHLVWHPGRRREKAIYDLVNELLLIADARRGPVPAAPAYRMLRDFVATAIRRSHQGGALPRGFQFAIARHAGYDPDEAPAYLFASAYEPLESSAAAGARR
jgi:hypothetical protein